MSVKPVSQRHHVQWPTLAWVWQKPHRVLGFGFGSGLLRPGSGTWASLLALLLWWPLSQVLDWHWQAVFIVGMLIAGVWICDRCVNELGVPDHVGIVWDEIAAVWLVLWAIPPVWWLMLVGFAAFRLFDVTKPQPIQVLDSRVGGGFGVMLDDLLAALYAIALSWVIWSIAAVLRG